MRTASMLLQALNERKVEIRVQYKPPVQMQGGTVSLDAFRNELVMRCGSDCWLMPTETPWPAASAFSLFGRMPYRAVWLAAR